MKYGARFNTFVIMTAVSWPTAPENKGLGTSVDGSVCEGAIDVIGDAGG